MNIIIFVYTFVKMTRYLHEDDVVCFFIMFGDLCQATESEKLSTILYQQQWLWCTTKCVIAMKLKEETTQNMNT